MSETDLENDIAVEIFILGPARTDMTGFEEAGEAAEAAGLIHPFRWTVNGESPTVEVRVPAT